MTDDLIQAAYVGGPNDGMVVTVHRDRPRIIAIPKAGGGYVRDDTGQYPVFVWQQVEQPTMGCRPIVVALVLSIPLWVAIALGAAAILGWPK